MKIQKQPAQPQITLVCIERNLNVPSTFLLNAHFGFPLFSFCVFLYLCEWGPEAVCVGHGTSGSSLTERGTVAGMWLFLLLLLGQLVGTGVHVMLWALLRRDSGKKQTSAWKSVWPASCLQEKPCLLLQGSWMVMESQDEGGREESITCWNCLKNGARETL